MDGWTVSFLIFFDDQNCVRQRTHHDPNQDATGPDNEAHNSAVQLYQTLPLSSNCYKGDSRLFLVWWSWWFGSCFLSCFPMVGGGDHHTLGHCDTDHDCHDSLGWILPKTAMCTSRNGSWVDRSFCFLLHLVIGFTGIIPSEEGVHHLRRSSHAPPAKGHCCDNRNYYYKTDGK